MGEATTTIERGAWTNFGKFFLMPAFFPNFMTKQKLAERKLF